MNDYIDFVIKYNDTRLRDDSLQDALQNINIDIKIPDQLVTRL